MVIKIGTGKSGAQSVTLGDASRTSRYAAEAKAAADRAEESAGTAADGARRAQAAAAVSAHPPVPGENGTWLVWDPENGEYTDSGENCRGEKGDKGDKGKDGSDDIFMAKYGHTTEAELVAALNAGKQIYAKNNHTPPSIYTLSKAVFQMDSFENFGYAFSFSRLDGSTLQRIRCDMGLWSELDNIVLAGSGDIPSLSPYRTAAAQDVIDSALSSRISEKLAAPATAGTAGQILEQGSNGPVWADRDKIVTVTGTTPTITAEANTRYVCGELATLDLTPPASGICDVVFTSGSTATVLTVPSTVKWANDFDPESLEANKTYELNICDGLGVAASWT